MGISVNTFGGLIDKIKEILAIIGNIQYVIVNIFKALGSWIMSIVYYIFRGLSFITSFCELLFNKMAGISPVYQGTQRVDNILLQYLFSDAVLSVFISMIVLSVFLLIVFTFIAVIKSEFTLDVKNSAKGPIFGRALKGLAMFFVTPVVTILGIYLTTALTQSLSQMFTGSGGGISNQIFYVAAYDANRVRVDQNFQQLFAQGWNNDGGNFRTAGDIDNAFKNTKQVVKTTTTKGEFTYQITPQKSESFKPEQGNFFLHAPDTARLLGADTHTLLLQYPDNGAFANSSELYYSIDNVIMVNYYYDLYKFDYLLGIGAILVVSWCLLTTCIALVKRIFDIVILWLISPAMISQYPLDNGDAAKKCNKEMISRVISVLASVFAFNMFFVIVPVFSTITIIPVAEVYSFAAEPVGSVVSSLGATDWLTIISQSGIGNGLIIAINGLTQIIGICVGASIIKQASALVSKMLGVEDLIKSGQDSVKNMVNTATKAVQTGFTLAAGAAAFKGMLGRGKAGDAIRKKAERDAAFAKEEAKNLGKTEEEANAIADKEYKNSLAKSKENMRKQAFSSFGGNFAKKYYESKSSLKDVYKPDKEEDDAVKAEKLKRQAAFELNQPEDELAKKRNEIKARQEQFVKEAEEKAAQEKADKIAQKRSDAEAKDAAKRAAIIAGLDSGKYTTSALNEAKIRTGAKYRPVRISKKYINEQLKQAANSAKETAKSAFEELKNLPSSIASGIKSIPTNIKKGASNVVQGVKAAKDSAVRVYHTTAQNIIMQKVADKTVKADMIEKAKSAGMDENKAQKTLRSLENDIKKLEKKAEEHRKKIK